MVRQNILQGTTLILFFLRELATRGHKGFDPNDRKLHRIFIETYEKYRPKIQEISRCEVAPPYYRLHEIHQDSLSLEDDFIRYLMYGLVESWYPPDKFIFELKPDRIHCLWERTWSKEQNPELTEFLLQFVKEVVDTMERELPKYINTKTI